MEQIIIGIVIFIVGIFAGWTLREYIAAWRVKHILKEYEDNLGIAKEKLIPITIEEHSGVYFVYDADGKFMVQANDRESLETALMDKYPGKLFAVTPENLRELGFN